MPPWATITLLVLAMVVMSRCQQKWQERIDHAQCAEDIGLKNLPRLGESRIGHWLAQTPSCVVDQEIQPPARDLGHRGYARRDRSRIRDVEGETMDVGVGGEVRHFARRAGGGDDEEVARGEGESEGRTDATGAAAGDEDGAGCGGGGHGGSGRGAGSVRWSLLGSRPSHIRDPKE